MPTWKKHVKHLVAYAKDLEDAQGEHEENRHELEGLQKKLEEENEGM